MYRRWISNHTDARLCTNRENATAIEVVVGEYIIIPALAGRSWCLGTEKCRCIPPRVLEQIHPALRRVWSATDPQRHPAAEVRSPLIGQSALLANQHASRRHCLGMDGATAWQEGAVMATASRPSEGSWRSQVSRSSRASHPPRRALIGPQPGHGHGPTLGSQVR